MAKDIKSEKVLERKLRHEVEIVMGGICLKLLSLHFNGIPDRLLLLPGGRVCFVEVKSYGKKPNAIQKIIHIRLRELGFDVRVVDRPEQIEQIKQDYGREL